MCARCFSLWFEQKLRQETKKARIERGDTVFLEGPNDSNRKVLAFFLGEQFAVTIVESPAEMKHSITASSLENEAEEVLDYFFDQEKKMTTKQKVMLTTVTQEDIEHYAEIRGITAEKRRTDSEITQIIKTVNERSLNITTGLANAGRVLKDL